MDIMNSTTPTTTTTSSSSQLKRAGDPVEGPSAKKSLSFCNMMEGAEFVTVLVDGELKNVSVLDLKSTAPSQNLATPQPQFASPPSNSTFISPPHTRNGTGYTPASTAQGIRQPAITGASLLQPQPANIRVFSREDFHPQAPPYSQPTQPIRHTTPTSRQTVSQPQSQLNLQQIQTQNHNLVQQQQQLKRGFKFAKGATKPVGSPTPTKIDHQLVAKINRLERVVYNEYEGFDAMSLKVQEMEVAVLHNSGFPPQFKEMREEIAALKANHVQITVEGDQAKVINDKFADLQHEDKVNKDKIGLLTSIVHRQNKEIESLKLSTVSTTAMFMSNTVQIGGIRQEINENCKSLALDFLRNRMNIHPPPQEIIQAKRFGEVQNKTVKGRKFSFPPPIEITCSPLLRQIIWENRQVLKGQKDPDFEWKFYVSTKKLEEHKASNARYRDQMQEIITRNSGKPANERDIPRIIGNRFTVNGEVVPDPIYPPDVKTMMNLTAEQVKAFDQIQFEISNAYALAKSTFKGFAMKAASYQDVELGYKKLKYEERYATHIMMGCLFLDGSKMESFSCDDGEASGGIEILNLLKNLKAPGHAIFVIRWKLGGNMGPRRFGCIKAVAKQSLEKLRMKDELISKNDNAASAPPTTTTPQTTSSTEEESVD